MPDEQQAPGAAFLRYGANLAGALSGGVVGAMVGDLPGAVFGAFLGESISSALSESISRRLSLREKERTGALTLLARDALLRKIEAGSTLRDDEFIRRGVDGRSAADEVVEHVLLVAQRTYEERKLPHLAALLATIAVADEMDEVLANWAVATLERLSWPKLVLLALIGANEDAPMPDIGAGQGLPDWQSWSIDRELQELIWTDNLVTRGEPRTRERGLPDFTYYLGSIRLNSGSKMLHWAADLESISSSERHSVLTQLTRRNQPD